MFHFFGERGFSFSCSLFSVFFLASSLCTHLLLKCFSFWSLHHSGGCWFPIEFCFPSCLGFDKLLFAMRSLCVFMEKKADAAHASQRHYTLMTCLLCASLSS